MSSTALALATLLTARRSPGRTAERRRAQDAQPLGPRPLGSRPATWRTRINSHLGFVHDSIDSLGFDWERIAHPGIAARYPLKVYLPRTTEDIVTVLKEAKALGETLHIRSKGHSSNDLVLTEPGGSVLVTEKLDQIIEVDEDAMTATVQAGAVSAQIDDMLSTRGLGLPIIGDHNHISVGGFASTGGVSPASHRFGLFVDNVVSLTYVDWDGEVVECSPEVRPEHFFAVMAGLGQHGVIATMTLRIMKVDKYATVLKNRQRHYFSFDRFLDRACALIADPGEALMERGVWVDYPRGKGGKGAKGGQVKSFGVGQFSAYHETPQTTMARLRDYVAYTYLDGIGWLTGRVPRRIGAAVKAVGVLGVIVSPRYGTIKNVERFSDKILNSMVGDPTRMFIVLAAVERLDGIVRAGYELMREYRAKHGCFTFVSVYVKSIKSPYLAQGGDADRFCELTFTNGIVNPALTPALLDELVERLDDAVIAHGGFRYMHTRTSKDADRRARIDPNVHYSAALATGPEGGSET